MTEKNIEFHPLETLPEIYYKVKTILPGGKKYLFDKTASGNGHEIIGLPLYSCIYNPVELIWAQVKGHLATYNNTFKMANIERLLQGRI